MAEYAIDHIVHDRIEKFYEMFGTLPRYVPVTINEYHQAEIRMGFVICVCASREQRDKRRLAYSIGGHDTELLVDTKDMRKLKGWDKALAMVPSGRLVV